MERHCELANQRLSTCVVSTPSIQKRRIGNGGRIVRSLLSNRPEMLVFGTHWWTGHARTFCGPVNKLARSVTNWTGGCDKRSARLIPYTHHRSDYRQDCHVGNTAQHFRLGPFQDYVIVEVEHSFPKSWMCKKQTSVSHSSTESEIISLDAGLRMDGLPALDLWDVVSEVLRSSKSAKNTNQPRSRELFAKSQIQTQTRGKPRC